jgi:hypothetical protein
VKTQVRILLAAAALVLLAGFIGLRSGNASLEAKLGRPGAEVTR